MPVRSPDALLDREGPGVDSLEITAGAVLIPKLHVDSTDFVGNLGVKFRLGLRIQHALLNPPAPCADDVVVRIAELYEHTQVLHWPLTLVLELAVDCDIAAVTVHRNLGQLYLSRFRLRFLLRQTE